MLGYRHYSDELVDYFVKKSIDNGIDILRIFDALNDVRNLQTAIDAAKKYGGHVQAAISYTTGPVFDIDYYCNYAKQLENAGADSICIKDMAGLLTLTELMTLLRHLRVQSIFLFNFTLTILQALLLWYTLKVLRQVLM